MKARLWSWLVLARAHFLAGGVLMYTMGVAAAYAAGASLDWPRLIWGQVGVTAIQLMTHFINEYYDAGRDALVARRTLFSGGSGILPAGRLGKRVAAVGAIVCASVGLAVILTIGGTRLDGPLPVYVVALLIGYGYSAPPLSLMSRGLGEIAAALTVALLTPLAGYSVAAGHLSAAILWLALPLVMLSLAFMIAVELPDYESDAPTGKRNWVVRLGRDRAGQLHNGLLASAYGLLYAVSATGHVPERVAALLWWTLPLALWQMGGIWLRIYRGWRYYNLMLGGGGVLIGLYGLLACLGFLL
jgi:1,4-dihydroxy-2-naphthoate octaprenyltransferase